MAERFHVTTPPAAGRAFLEGDEARHLAKVLRGRVGDEVTLFDGRGLEWPARIAAIDRDRVALETGDPRPAEPLPARRVAIGAALPKGDRQKWMVEKLTELGATTLVPLETTRGVAEATAGARARLERVVIEACKQCGRNTLLEIAEPRSLDRLLAEVPAGTRLLVAHPGGAPIDADGPLATTADVLALVGPEGGFTAAELAAADAAGATRVGLGPHVLRVETAAIALAARLAGWR
ncbi:MAG: Ribosomal small subunit methyltransferase [Planctomycetota bacterium]|jgi:16S rRNA (uracil1498-N3)-methyltransferase